MSALVKDPDARLDYGWDWSAWLADGETITSAVVTGRGVTVDGSASVIAGTSVVAWVTGGAAGSAATLQCQITTSALRSDQRSIALEIRQR